MPRHSRRNRGAFRAGPDRARCAFRDLGKREIYGFRQDVMGKV